MRSLRPDVTEGPRQDILSCVGEVPGIHLRSIERRTDLPLGQVLYHLDRLERMGLVSSLRDRGFRRYYVTQTIGRGEKRMLAALRHATPRRILLALLRGPRRTHKELLDDVGVAGSTLSFHLQRLVEAGILRRLVDGGATRYEVAEPALAVETLVEHAASFNDGEVHRFAAEQRRAPAPTTPPATRDEPLPTVPS
jgi:predicted transcriptional regulator